MFLDGGKMISVGDRLEVAGMQVSAAVLCSQGSGAGASSETDQAASSLAGSSHSTHPAQLYNTAALKLWLLQSCQGSRRGGMRDKPGTGMDYYHTCYCLSGLASCQAYSGQKDGLDLLARADPLCNVVEPRLEEALAHYNSLVDV